MTLTRLVIVRHAQRLDKQDKSWQQSSATPYDTPLSQIGKEQAVETGIKLKNHPKLAFDRFNDDEQVIIHSSPFLRCAQTAAWIAKGLDKKATIRLDAAFGEFLSEDYFDNSAPPPPDNHQSLYNSSQEWLRSSLSKDVGIDSKDCTFDSVWPFTKFGNSGEYGELFDDMRKRFTDGLARLIGFYNGLESPTLGSNSNKTVIIVTHGAGFNPLITQLSNKATMTEIGLSSFAIAQREGLSWSVVYNSNNDDKMPTLSMSSTNSSTSSMGEYWNMAGVGNKQEDRESSNTTTTTNNNNSNDSKIPFTVNSSTSTASTVAPSRNLTPTIVNIDSLANNHDNSKEEDEDDERLYMFGGNQL